MSKQSVAHSWRLFKEESDKSDIPVNLWEIECLLKFNKERPATNIYTDIRGLDGVVIVKTASQAIDIPGSEKKIVRLHIKFTPHDFSINKEYMPWLVKKVQETLGVEGIQILPATLRYIGHSVSAYT